jgi:hypothetical protein
MSFLKKLSQSECQQVFIAECKRLVELSGNPNFGQEYYKRNNKEWLSLNSMKMYTGWTFNQCKLNSDLPYSEVGKASKAKPVKVLIITEDMEVKACNRCDKDFYRTDENRAFCPPCAEKNRMGIIMDNFF